MLNRAIKWDSQNTTIPDMVDLIESEVIANCSESDLMKLEKGLHKTWVLAIGNGFRCRYYPSSTSPVRLCCTFHILTHQIQQITLQDTINKVEYFIPGGKESCKKLQRVALRRLNQYTSNKTGTEHSSGQGGRFLSQKKSTHPKKWIGLCVLGMLSAGAVFTAFNLPLAKNLFGSLFQDTPEWVVTVQNGYLGEFTDLTVYELLDNYRSSYENEVWDGGTTDQGNRITEVRFTSPNTSDSATIQFKMLNDEVFKVSAFMDTTLPNMENSDVIYVLTLSYYSGAVFKYMDDDAQTARLHGVLRGADAGEIIYGAAAGYTGDRTALYLLENGSPMGLSAAELLEYYGASLADSPDYRSAWNSQLSVTTAPDNNGGQELRKFTVDELFTDLNQNPLRASTKYLEQSLTLTGQVIDFNEDGKVFFLGGASENFTLLVACTIADEGQLSDLMNANIGDSITIRCKVTNIDSSTGYEVDSLAIEEIAPGTPRQNDSNTTNSTDPQTGTVRWSSTGLRVRSGPSTSYPIIRTLEPGTTVTITEQEYADDTYWGRIEDGWICMDYVDLGAQPAQPTDSSSTSVNMTVCVKFTVGELKIRSGPDTSYPQVGSFYGGEVLTVTELQQNGGRQWGRIPDGWICIDYVDTIYGSQSEFNSAQRFVGSWIESSNGNKRTLMTIQTAEYGSFLIEIQASLSASETMYWYTIARYNADQDSILYSSCKCWISVSDGSGSFYDDVQYWDGQGRLYFSNGYLYWQDYTSGTKDCPFVPS